jgi:predicted transcriptional regulator
VLYATLVDSIIDVNQAEIAKALGVELPHRVITEAEAGQINARLSKGRPTS